MSAVMKALQDCAQHQGDVPALYWGNGHLSYRELAAEAYRIADWLLRADVHRLAIGLGNGPAWVILDLAAIAAGITVVPLPVFFSAEQTRHVLTAADIDTLVVSADASSLGQPLATCFLEVAKTECRVLRLKNDETPEGAQTTAKITFTSGTTGRPMGVCLSQPVMEKVAESLSQATAELAIQRHLCVLPLATLLENLAGIYAPLLAGATIIVPSLRSLGLEGAWGPDPYRFWAALERFQPHSLILIPQFLRVLTDLADTGFTMPDSLRFIAVGGACVAPALIRRARTLGLPVYEGYGLSECASVVTLNTPAADRLGSVGRPLPHVRLRIRNDGEIEVAGASMAGYLGETSMNNTFLPTGDLGFLDPDGFLYLNGRKKDVFITAYGRNVSPEWLEAELTQELPILQAAVFGEAKPWNVALIVPRHSEIDRNTVDQAVAHVNQRLPDYARVRAWLPAKPFSICSGEVTPNGRLRRGVVWRRYRNAIESIYQQLN